MSQGHVIGHMGTPRPRVYTQRLEGSNWMSDGQLMNL
jgi:hypothetical protein